ncbi:MAG TPA: 2-oxoglutarate dehydrogenase E1 component [Chitinophagales bacterium]|nr:2-oxoglutarate dehydrogenase E1 component [Chitinophagales bacterium]
MDTFSYIANAEPAYIESLYHSFRTDPSSIDGEWRKFFEGFDFAQANFSSNGSASVSSESLTDEFRTYALILAYREKGHLVATTNPLRPRKDRHANLKTEDFGFSKGDMSKKMASGSLVGMQNATLEAIIAHLEACYCNNLGFEYDYIIEPAEKKWFEQQIESRAGNFGFSAEKKRRILSKLNETVVFEQFLDKKYIGQKRFSLEGGESTIPALDAIINAGASAGVVEFVFAMAHRGRLNVLANILGKTYEQIFNEFEGNAIPDTTMGDGDVKYHLGYSSQVTTLSGNTVHLKLTPNPSHLEAVNPVLQGFVRAKSDVLYNEDEDRILPICIHGDAAIAGQGVVYEVLQMSKLNGYKVGGTIHFVINNQIGFTTDFDDARSSNYCTSYAATVQAPVIHVNGDDAEAVVFACELAVAYRQEFNKDVFVDMVCYRKHGHNEGDDPKYTQPTLYKIIDAKKNPREIYVQKLLASDAIDRELANAMEQEFWNVLQQRLDAVKQHPLTYQYQPPEEAWRKLKKVIDVEKDFATSPETKVTHAQLQSVLDKLFTTPDGFVKLKKIEKLFETNKKLIAEGRIDWALGELIAYGTILLDGRDVRMSGQDVRRGTFSHRHAVLREENTNAEYIRLNHLAEKQGKFRIFNSLLSEFGVLGFEFGYSLASPDHLVIWEAQFGDFNNGAQTIIDQFIAASVSKWQRMSGLVMLLPHGYEGQGPEHSSARLERFLQLCAEGNIIVTNITTPANFFHALRRQLAFDFRRPMVNMSPKSLLRHPMAQSQVTELTEGKFQEVIEDNIDPKHVKRVVLCSGKLYYDLLDYRQKNNRNDVALVRIEQLYPFPETQLERALAAYSGAEVFWAQEEPRNMGAWYFMQEMMGRRISEAITRKPSASPATGFAKIHAREQQEIVEQAFGTLN